MEDNQIVLEERILNFPYLQDEIVSKYNANPYFEFSKHPIINWTIIEAMNHIREEFKIPLYKWIKVKFEPGSESSKLIFYVEMKEKENE